eukprot:m.1072402 g.1072402  ORF g.1072402 m.1072402 type:complete len:114 (+) comp24231_c0_seq113:3375-3716(+)
MPAFFWDCQGSEVRCAGVQAGGCPWIKMRLRRCRSGFFIDQHFSRISMQSSLIGSASKVCSELYRPARCACPPRQRCGTATLRVTFQQPGISRDNFICVCSIDGFRQTILIIY